MDNLAPIGLCVYNRLSHLRKTVAALQNNALAPLSELYIFSDAAKRGDEEKVAIIRSWLPSITGFHKIHIIERTRNYNSRNIFEGMKQLIDLYGKCIWVEDDIITAPGFLAFMNEALEFYKDDETIFNITGYMPPIQIPSGFKQDVFASYRMSTWGLGLFPRTLSPIIEGISQEEYQGIIDRNIFNIFGPRIFNAFQDEIDGLKSDCDTRGVYYQTLHNKLTIVPRKSLVNTIGNDGSGVRIPYIEKYDIKELWLKQENFVFEKEITFDPTIRKRLAIFWEGGKKTYIKRKLLSLFKGFP